MKKRALIASVLVLASMVGRGMVLGAEPPATPANPLVAQAAPAENQDLLLFFEEQDLVTATKRATPLRKAPAIATIITADEIGNMGARNLLDVLRMVPGIGLSIKESGNSFIEVRGIKAINNEKILFMIDGHSLNKTLQGSGTNFLAETIPVEQIRQVEVVRGPGSALYGNSAFIATINVITRNAEEVAGVELKGGAGSFDTFKGNMVAGGTYGDKLSAMGSLDHTQTQGAKLRVESDAIRATPFSKAPGTPLLGVEQTDAFLKVFYGDFSFRGQYFSKHKEEYIGLGYALADENWIEPEYYWGELAHSRKINENLTSTLKLYYDHSQQVTLIKIRPNGFINSFPEGKIGVPLAQDRTLGSELQLDWTPFAGNHLIAGAAYEDLRQYDVKQLANFNPANGAYIGAIQEVANWNQNVTRQTWALYLQDEWQMAERVNLTAGVRHDHYSDFGGTVNPRVGLVWNALEKIDLKLLYGQAFRAPCFAELYTINNPVVNGNPANKPERIKTYEAGATYRWSRILAADLNYFSSEISDLIVRGTAIPPIYINAGQAETQGVELGLHGSAFDSFRWNATYTYQDPRDVYTGLRLPDVPQQRAHVNFNQGLNRYLNIHADLFWTGSRPRAKGDTRAEMPDFTTVDLAVTGRNFFKEMELQLAIHNLFDQRFSDPDTSGALNLIPGDFPREGISAMLTATYKF